MVENGSPSPFMHHVVPQFTRDTSCYETQVKNSHSSRWSQVVTELEWATLFSQVSGPLKLVKCYKKFWGEARALIAREKCS